MLGELLAERKLIAGQVSQLLLAIFTTPQLPLALTSMYESSSPARG
jgi:hypothetical protein